MIVVEARMTVRPGAEDDFAAAVRELIAGTRTEPDHLSYSVSRDLIDASTYVFVEHWADLDAFGRHLRTDHYLAYAAANPAWIVGKRVLFHEVSATTER